MPDNAPNPESAEVVSAASGGIKRREFLRRVAVLVAAASSVGGLVGVVACDDGATVLTPPPTVPTQMATPVRPTPLVATATNGLPTQMPIAPATKTPEPTAAATATSSPTSTPTEVPTSTPEPSPTATEVALAQPRGDYLSIDLDLLANPYNSQRSVIIARRGVVATSQPLAVQAGIAMLQKGGSAVDAAIATAIALTVVEPTSNGIGADAFALVWDGQKLHGLNASGRAPAALTLEAVRAAGNMQMPSRGWEAITVPGAVSAWGELHARFGKLPFADLFEPAISYAERGHALSPIVAYYWDRSTPIYTALSGPEYGEWARVFAPGGRAPRAGEVWASPTHADTLRKLSLRGADDFYRGDLARTIASFAGQTGGYITEADLAAHRADWVDPITTLYRGYDVWEIPPNGQGIAALIGLNILEGFDLAANRRDSVESFHLQIESLKLGFADTLQYVADPQFADVPTAALLDKGYAARRRELIGRRALDPQTGDPNSGGTVYLCAVDGDGMMVSFIQSNYMGFGSGVVVPGTGISLQNRGANFSLDPASPNRLAPGKRPYHTIIPGFLTREGQAIGPFGVMGGFMQPQGHLQVIANTIDYNLNPQAALDAPRWQWISGRHVQIESDAGVGIAEGLRAMEHQIEVLPPGGSFGRGQIIWRLDSGAYAAGSEKRSDGYAAGI